MKKTILGIGILMLTITGSLFAFDDVDCKSDKKWQGSFTRSVLVGEGPAQALYAEQIQFLADGTAILYATYYLETPVKGSSTPGYGRWTCREDGKIAVTVLFGNFGPYPPEIGGIGPTLHYHVRLSALFSISGPDTLNRNLAVARIYPRGTDPNADPNDPNTGFLLAPDPTQATYDRLNVSNADLGQ